MPEPIIELGTDYEIDEDSTGDLIIRHVDNGEVLKYDASADETTIPDLNTGSGIWTEDGNSPQTATGTGSDTYTLSGTYDEVLVRAQVENVGASIADINLRADGDSGANYIVTTLGGARSTGNKRVEQIARLTSGGHATAAFVVNGRWGSNWFGSNPGPKNPNTGTAVAFQNSNISSPLDSLTVLSAENFDITWEVFGRDIGPGGAP